MSSSTMLGPPVGYIDILNDGTSEAVAKEKRRFNPLRPSSSGKCTRELAYELAEFHGLASYEKEVLKPEQVRIFDLGHHVETHAIRQFEKYTGAILEAKYKQQVLHFYSLEARNHPELSQIVEGSLDSCFWSPGSKGVVDYKSKKDKFSSFRKSKWEEDDEKLSKMASVERISDFLFWVNDLPAFLAELKDPFFEANFLQLNGYACTEFLRSRGVDHGAVIQYNKNDSRMREVRFRPSMELFNKVRAKFQTALDAVDAGKPEQAPKDHLLGSMKCAFCPFAKQCWNEDSLRAWFTTFPKKQWPTDTGKMGADGEMLEKLLAQFEELDKHNATKSTVEEQILKVMADKEVTKVRTTDGAVYEARHYKSPRPHFELKRGKV